MMVPRRRISLAYALLTWGGGRLASLLMLGLSLWALSVMHDSPLWRVEWVEVAGCSLVSPERVVAAGDLAEAWAVSLDPEEVARRVESVPGVVEAHVTLGWPNRVRISVVEDQPLATLRVGDREYWVSRHEGLIAPYGTAEGLPVLQLVGADSGAPSLPGRVLTGLTAMRAAFPERTEYLYRAGRGF
ncbi:MAG: FtsQ-type POTRA domain-containing protein, partial [Anaerolineae bacterium]|nr:FtsQ-type POTRA domain-containing protein [Anaerolineae bacterium]